MWELKHDSVLWLFHCSPQSSVDILFWVSSQALTCSPSIENTSTMHTNDETTATQLQSFVSLCCCTGLLLSAILHGIKALHTHHQTFYSVKGRKAILKHPSVLWILAPWNNMYLYSEIAYKSRLFCLLMSRLLSTTVSVPLAKSHDMWPEIQLIIQTHACNHALQVLPTTSLVYMSYGSTWDIPRTVDSKPGHHLFCSAHNLLCK